MNESKPAVAGVKVKPGWSGTEPQEPSTRSVKAREAAGSRINAFLLSRLLSPAPRALQVLGFDPGVPLTPATAGLGLVILLESLPVDFLCKAQLFIRLALQKRKQMRLGYTAGHGLD
ncbi:MAG TPA: hypothetical protein VEW46_20760 [Pyrinomonadaceae bacterium]|nr:hypothetical protein [Pyrinomonadaceae bacterium]